MKLGNWVPLDKNLAKHLPRDKPFSLVEAAFSVSLDYDCDNKVTVAGYASRWGWSRKRVNGFLEKLGVYIQYPENTSKKRNQKGHIALHKRGIKGTKEGHIRFIDSKWIDDKGDIKGTYKGHKRDIKGSTTINPNPNPNPESSNPPNPPTGFDNLVVESLSPEGGDGGCVEDASVTETFRECEKYLGISPDETLRAWNKCGEENQFAEAVQCAIEMNEREVLRNPVGFIIHAFQNKQTSKRTRNGLRRNGSANKEHDDFLEVLEEDRQRNEEYWSNYEAN